MPQAPWSASAVEARAVAALLPYAGNARTHSAEQVAQIAASILEFGFVAPVLVDEGGEIIAGHGRLLAAKSLGLDTVPTIVRAGLTEAQKAAYRLADNRIALNAGWDEALLAAEVARLQAMGEIDLVLTGFDAGELDRLLGGLEPVATDPGNPAVATPANAGQAAGDDPEPDPADAEPEPPRAAVTRPGDLWLLGDHRLLCGDSADAAAVARVMAGDRAALLFTTPPYGNQRAYTTGGVSDWDALMQGVFATLDGTMQPDGQVLVNLGLIHREGEWQPYWPAGWTGCAARAGAGSASTPGTRAPACPAIGTAAWLRPSSWSSTSTARPARPTRSSPAAGPGRPTRAVACAPPMAR